MSAVEAVHTIATNVHYTDEGTGGHDLKIKVANNHKRPQ